MVNKIQAADALTLSVEKEAYRLNSSLPKTFVRRFNTQTPDEEMTKYILDQVYNSSAKQAPLMRLFIISNLGLPDNALTDFVQSPYSETYSKCSWITKQIKDSNSLQPLRQTGGVFNSKVMEQTDRTLMRLGRDKRYIRYVDGGACDWCKEQVQVFEITGVFARHDNCRCLRLNIGV